MWGSRPMQAWYLWNNPMSDWSQCPPPPDLHRSWWEHISQSCLFTRNVNTSPVNVLCQKNRNVCFINLGPWGLEWRGITQSQYADELTHEDGGPGDPHGQDYQQHFEGHPAQGVALELVKQGHLWNIDSIKIHFWLRQDHKGSQSPSVRSSGRFKLVLTQVSLLRFFSGLSLVSLRSFS